MLIVVEGETGSGKTMLVDTVLAEATPESTAVARVTARPAHPRSGVRSLAHAFRLAETEWVSRPPPAEVGARPVSAPDLGSPARNLEPSADPDEWLRSLHRLLKRGPLVTVIDDAQWADRELLEAAMLALRAGTIPDRAGLAVIVITRPVARPLGDGILDRVRDRAHLLGLTGLDPASVGELVEQTLGAQHVAVATELWRRTAGNPRLVDRVLSHADPADTATGEPIDVDRLIGHRPGSPMRAAVADAVLGHLEGLDPDVVQMLRVAALAQPWFDPLICARVADTDKSAVDVADAALAAGLVIEHPDVAGRWAFRHDLVRIALAARLSTVRAATIHARLGRALFERHGFDHDTIVDIAEHLARGASAHHDRLVAVAAHRAVTVCLDRQQDQQATAIARLATEQLGRAPLSARDPSMMAELLIDLARGLKRIGEPPGCAAAARAAFEIALAVDDPSIMARAALAFHGGPVTTPWLGYWAPLDEAIELLEGASAALGPPTTDPDLWFQLQLSRAEAYAMVHDRTRAEAAADAALDLAVKRGDPTWQADAVLQGRRVVELDVDGRKRVRAMSAVRTITDPTQPQRTLALRLQLVEQLEQADASGARTTLADLTRAGHQAQASPTALDADLATLAVDMLLGRLRHAELRIGAVRKQHRHRAPNQLAVLDLQHTYLLYLRHRLGPLAGEFERRLAHHDTPSWRAPLAVALCQAGRETEAGSLIDSMADRDFTDLHETPLQFLTAFLLADAVLYLGDRRRAAQLAEVLAPHDHRLVAFSDGHILGGWVGLQRGRLLALLGRHPEAETAVRTAADRARRLGSPLFELWAEVALADIDQGRGRRPRRPLNALAVAAADRGYGVVVAVATRSGDARVDGAHRRRPSDLGLSV